MSKPCERCGGEKSPIRGARYCDICRGSTPRAIAERAAQNQARDGAPVRSDGRKIVRMSKKLTPEGTKWCNRCQRFLPRDKFRVGKNGLAPYCPPCQKAYYHERSVLTKYGITADEYYAILATQNGTCAICGRKPKKYMLAVDHDHQTGAVRGLLCKICNHRLLGAAMDRVDVLQRAIDYLTDPTANRVGTVAVSNEARIRSANEALEDAIDAALADAERERVNSRKPFAAALVRRRGGRWIAVLDLEMFAGVLRESASDVPARRVA